jgi:hypothetical protein
MTTDTLFVCDYCGTSMRHPPALPPGWLSVYKTACGTRRTCRSAHECWVKQEEEGASVPAAPKSPSRLDRAKAALEGVKVCLRESQAAVDADMARLHSALAELVAAEKEAARLASIAAIPPLLLEAMSTLRECTKDSVFYPSDIVKMLARSHGIPPETLRAALEVKP